MSARSIGRITAEYLIGEDKSAKRRILFRFVIADAPNQDAALKRAVERAEIDGYQVVSANFRATDGAVVDKIVVHIEKRG